MPKRTSSSSVSMRAEIRREWYILWKEWASGRWIMAETALPKWRSWVGGWRWLWDWPWSRDDPYLVRLELIFEKRERVYLFHASSQRTNKSLKFKIISSLASSPFLQSRTLRPFSQQLQCALHEVWFAPWHTETLRLARHSHHKSLLVLFLRTHYLLIFLHLTLVGLSLQNIPPPLLYPHYYILPKYPTCSSIRVQLDIQRSHTCLLT